MQVYTYVIYSGDIINPPSGYANGFSEYKVKTICMADKDGDKVLEDIEKKLKSGGRLSNQDVLDLIFTPIMGGRLSKKDKIVLGIKLSKDYPMEKTDDIQAMLFVFAHKFLEGKDLKKVMEAIKMTKLGKMLREDGIKEGIEKGIEKGIEEGIEKSRIKVARNLLKGKSLSKEEIARNVELSLEQVEEIEKELMSLK